MCLFSTCLVYGEWSKLSSGGLKRQEGLVVSAPHARLCRSSVQQVLFTEVLSCVLIWCGGETDLVEPFVQNGNRGLGLYGNFDPYFDRASSSLRIP